MSYIKNAVLGVLAIALMAGVGAPVARAQTNADMQAQIAALLAQVQALTAQLNANAAPSNFTFTRNLTVGSTGNDVMALQQFLNTHGCTVSLSGAGSVGLESAYFGAKSKAAVACWQAAHNISPAVGYFGPITRAAVNAANVPVIVILPPVIVPPVILPPVTPGLSGGAGSVNDYSLVSSLSNEEVGEDANDVKIAGLEVEADDGSDLQFTALRLVFDEGTGATHDFEDYADEVSIWLGTDEIARVDATDFNDNNSWSKTVSLDSDAIIRAGDTGTFYVAVSGVNNLDTADIGDVWDVDFESARFRDAQGATISENPNVAATSFSFETFAASADTNFKITNGLDSVNDAHVINVASSSDDTSNVSILSFNVEIEGNSDVLLDAMPVTITVATTTNSGQAANVDQFISGLTLWMDGEEVGSVNLSTDCLTDTVTTPCVDSGYVEDYLFDNLDLTLSGGSDYDFLVKADIRSTSDAGVADSDTIFASFGESETDLASFSAEDESGEDLADTDTNGSVSSDASEVRDVGIMVTLVSVDADVNAGDPNASTSDSGTFLITFDVTSFDGDAWIDATAPTVSGGTTESDIDVTGTGTVLSSITSPSGATNPAGGADAFQVVEDTTERFAITTNVLATASGFFNVALADLLYALTDLDGDIQYTFNLDAFKTGNIFLNDY